MKSWDSCTYDRSSTTTHADRGEIGNNYCIKDDNILVIQEILRKTMDKNVALGL